MKKLSVLIPLYNRGDVVRRTINSIPKRDDIEIIVCDDCSTDNGKEVVKEFDNVILLENEVNMGVGYTMNKLYDAATGEYVVPLGSDDYFYTRLFDKFLNELDGTDMVYFNLECDDGTIYQLREDTKYLYCGSTKATRREFLGSSRCAEIRRGEDWYLFKELMSKNPTEKFTDITFKHYTTDRNDRLTKTEKLG